MLMCLFLMDFTQSYLIYSKMNTFFIAFTGSKYSVSQRVLRLREERFFFFYYVVALWIGPLQQDDMVLVAYPKYLNSMVNIPYLRTT